jgi:glycosyltransferase involved in cell wall biosynthesis
MHNIAIIIPAHNEEKRIGATLKAYLSYFNRLVKARKLEKFKIIAVINASTDKTLAIVRKHKQKNLEYLEFTKGGKGFAVIEGFKHALKADYTHIGFVDADMATTPEEYYRLFTKAKGYDGAIASRYLPGAKLNPRNTLPRILASRLYNFFIRALLILPYRDTQCGAKIFKKDALIKILGRVGMTSWAFDIEMLYLINKAGLKIREMPTVWSNKDYSKINFWRAGPWMALAIVRLRIINSPFRGMVRIYDKFIRVFKPAK